MGPIITRTKLIAAYVAEMARHGLPEVSGRIDREVLFIVDGVGGFQAAPVMIRRALRQSGSTLGTVMFAWQTKIPGEIWTDLMWLRRNRYQGLMLARKLLAFHRAHPAATIHLLACSGGAGISLFALEAIERRARARARRCDRPGAGGATPLLGTLVLACPAVSPTYCLAPALRMVTRCYAIVSRRDSIVLGLGTRFFGTTDRRFTRSAGMVGFRVPAELGREEAVMYERLREIRWTPELRAEGHNGGHAGAVSLVFLKRHLLPMLKGAPSLPLHAVDPDLPDGPTAR